MPPTDEVERPARARRPSRRGQRADHGEGGEVDALGTQAGAARGGEHPLDHVAASRHEHDALARALRVSTRPSDW